MFNGRLLLQWREQYSLSQTEAAQRVNITQEYWHFLESGQRKPSLDVLEVISKVTGIKKSVLLGEEEKLFQ